jgi:hypothetical protein
MHVEGMNFVNARGERKRELRGLGFAQDGTSSARLYVIVSVL